MPKVALDEIEFDPKVYPRERWSTATIDRYADAMRGDEQFPPIVLKKTTKLLLDGVHRWKAAIKIRDDGAENNGTIEVDYHVVPDGVPDHLYAASLSARNGLQLTSAESRDNARRTVEANPEFNTVTLAKLLAVSDETARSYVGDILAKRRDERAVKAFRLSRLGWTQAEIGEVLCVERSVVSRDMCKIQELGESTLSQLAEGHAVEEVARRQGLPEILVRTIQCDGKDDAERLDLLSIKIQPYDVWHFAGCHDLMGDKHPGRIPGELVAHVLYFYTKPKDIVIDPMAGSGTTLDACLLMNRRCFGFDLDDRHERVDIIKHDMATGWPEQTAKASLVFWDPPYFSKKDDEYVDGSVSGLSHGDYMEFFSVQLAGAHDKIKKGARLAFLMSDWDGENWQGKKGAGEELFIWDYAKIITDAGWTLKRHIQVPLPTQQVHPDIVNKFRESRRLARLERYLLIAEA